MEETTFVTLAVNPFWLDQTILLAESLRAFGGPLADAPLKLLNPAGTRPLPEEFIKQIPALRAEIIPVEIEEAALKFPLGFLPFAAAEGEKLTAGSSQQMVWILPDTLIISSLESLMLSSENQLAYRPVHHSNIGSPVDEELDPYWSLVYHHCQVPEERVFPMATCTRDKTLRPYINAGMLVVRPEQGFMQAWMQSFRSAYQHEDFQPLLQDQRNAIFLHQAVVSGMMMHRYAQDEFEVLPEAVNYPLHLHDEYPVEHRPKTLNQLITCRYENFDELGKGMKKILVEDPLDKWIEARINKPKVS